MLKKVLLSLIAATTIAAPINAQNPNVVARDQFQRPNSFVAPPQIRKPMPPQERVVPFTLGMTAFDVKNFGAVCNGSTDDTVAIQDTYNAAAAAMKKQGGAGIVYFPPSTGYCVVSTLHIPSMGYPQGWLTSLFDNGLFVTNTIYPGNFTAFIGRTSNFAAMGNVFLWGPTAEWQKPKWSDSTANPVADIEGVTGVYFEGIAFANGGENFPYTVHIHDDNGSGSTNLTFDRCSIIGDFQVNSSASNQVAGFGLHIRDSSLSGNLNIENFGSVTIQGGYLHTVRMANNGISTTGNLEISDTLSEAITNEDFLTIDTSGGDVNDITLNRVALADSVGTVYMVKHVNNTYINWNPMVKFEMIPEGNTGTGLIDPASAPELLSVICEGSGCQYVLGQAKAALYMFIGMPPKSPVILYGSQYIGNPLSIVQ